MNSTAINIKYKSRDPFTNQMSRLCESANYTHKYLWKGDKIEDYYGWLELKKKSPASYHDTYQEYVISAICLKHDFAIFADFVDEKGQPYKHGLQLDLSGLLDFGNRLYGVSEP